jgi:hypothetical protein
MLIRALKFTVSDRAKFVVKLGLVGFWLIFLRFSTQAQVCGTSGIDGPSTNTNPINTYYPVSGNRTLNAGATSILLEAVPATDAYGNNYGNIGIRPGDLILIIQMQDARINADNSNLYGGGANNTGPDGLGGTGYTNIGFSGKFEYVIALNAVPITGGTLNFRGGSAGGGAVNEYVNAAPTGTRGQRRFQIVRVPQYSNLTLTSDITTVPYNGKAGGVIAFDVAGNMNFGGFKIDASQKGFRGGYGKQGNSGANNENEYVVNSSSSVSVGKGEGIAGTPRYMYDGYKDFDNVAEGLPGGSYGRGAPANGGGGGNDHNAGGGGGANGGFGGVGGWGWQGAGGDSPSGGRPGTALPQDLTRLIMGGGGGGGDANNVLTTDNNGNPLSAVKGGVGGGIILVNVEKITGAGLIVANGGAGAPGVLGAAPDGAGGGGAGGTVFVRSLANSAGATLTIQANGGRGGNTEGDRNNEHGPGGGGGGGVIYHNVPGAVIIPTVTKGLAGKADSGNGTSHYAEDGTAGLIVGFSNNQLPSHLQGGGKICYPELTTTLTEANPGIPGSRNPGATASYTLTITNATTGGNAGGVQTALQLPSGFTISSITATLVGGSAGAINPTYNLVGGVYQIGDSNVANAYNIPPGGQVVFTISVAIANNVAEGMHHASAQATYLDPTRTSANPNRRVAAKNNAFTGSNTAYETGGGGDVGGTNYNGNAVSSTGEDVHINAKPRPNNFEMDVIECDNKAEGTLSATDPDAAHTPATLTYALEGTYDTSKGTLTLSANGSFSFVPLVRFFGTITIQFRVTDPLGAYDIGTLKINQPKPLLDITETITHISAFGANDGAINIVSSGGVGARTHKWLYPDGSQVTATSISNLKPGSYTLTVTDENNCKYSETYIVREPPLVTLLPANEICVGETSILLPYTDPKVNPTSYSIVWDAAALAAGLANVSNLTLPTIVAPATQANITITVPANIAIGTYNGILRVHNASGDSSGPLSFTITIHPYPVKAHILLIN